MFLTIMVLAHVECLIRPNFLTLSMLLVFKPVTFISGSISEFHCAASVAETAQPLSIVGGAGGPVFMGSNGELALKLRLIVVEEEQDV